MPGRTGSGSLWEDGDDWVILVGSGLAVGFVRTGDRWTHSLAIPDDRGIEVARVVEGQSEGDPARVMSPVYQELQRHEPPGGTGLCLLLTGLWFGHHFSAAVSLTVDPSQSEVVTLDFDVADRCRAGVDSLAATYVVPLGSGSLGEAGPDRIVWNLDGQHPGRLELLADSSSSLALAEAGRTAMRVQVLATIHPGVFTHRLRYRWRWTSSMDRTR